MIKFTFILLLFSLQPAFAQHDGGEQGGHHGNGGGTVDCKGQPLVVLDYDEARTAAKKEGAELLDLEKMTRKEFFEEITRRLELGSQDLSGRLQGIQTFNWGSMHTLLDRFPPLSEWPTVKPWKIKDEFVDGNLRPECTYRQAAIVKFMEGENARMPYRIPSVTDRLSKGQSYVLELHEYLNQFNYWGNSINVRELVGALIRKHATYPSMRLAEITFFNPLQDFFWKNDQIWVRTPFGESENLDHAVFDWTGIYALNVVNKTEEEREHLLKECANWAGIVPSNHGDFVLQLFHHATAKTENIFLPYRRHELLNSSIVSDVNAQKDAWASRFAYDKSKKQLYRRGIQSNGSTEPKWDLTLEKLKDGLIIDRGTKCDYVFVRLYPKEKLSDETVAWLLIIRAYYEEISEGVEPTQKELFERLSRQFNWQQ